MLPTQRIELSQMTRINSLIYLYNFVRMLGNPKFARITSGDGGRKFQVELSKLAKDFNHYWLNYNGDDVPRSIQFSRRIEAIEKQLKDCGILPDIEMWNI